MLLMQRRTHGVQRGPHQRGASTELTVCMWTKRFSVLSLRFLICTSRGDGRGLAAKYLWKEGKGKGEKEEGRWERGESGRQKERRKNGPFPLL